MTLVSHLPRATLSRLAGRVARSPASRWLIPWFAHHYRVNRADAVVPPGGYRSLQQFFTRELQPGLRPIDAAPGVLVSPVDGTLTTGGRIERGQLVQAKGQIYSVTALLADAVEAQGWEGGFYATLYLAPAEYHRVHAPAAGAVWQARYLPGDYWPVNPRAVASVPGLLASNERLITTLETQIGRLAVVMVGACLVGGIRVNYDLGWNAGPGPHLAAERNYDPPHTFARGQELGQFEFGSTVIVLAEAALGAELTAPVGAELRMGQALARCTTAAPAGAGARRPGGY